MNYLKIFGVIFLLAAYTINVQTIGVNFNSVSIQFPCPNGIDWHEPTNTLLLSVNYYWGSTTANAAHHQGNCNTQDLAPGNFARIEFDGTQVPFASTVSDMIDEIKIACVRSGNVGGFVTGECYTGNGVVNQVLKISADGLTITNPWVQDLGDPQGYGSSRQANFLRGALYVDYFGNFDGQLAISGQPGYAYLVNSAGQVTWTGWTPYCNAYYSQYGLACLEGVLLIPDNPSLYGSLANKLIGGGEADASVWVFDPKNNVQTAVAYPLSYYGCNPNPNPPWSPHMVPEDFDIVLPNENFFAIDYANGLLIGAQASEWTPYWNQILMTTEWTGFYIIESWPSPPPAGSQTGATIDSNYISCLNINNYATISGLNGNYPGSYEHVAFVKAGILEIAPADPICYLFRNSVTGVSFNMYPFSITSRAVNFYNYNSLVNPYSSNFGSTIPSISGVSFSKALTIFPVIDYQNLISIIFQAGEPHDNIVGNVEFTITSTGYTSSIGANLVLGDDINPLPSGADDFQDTFAYSSGQGDISLKWGASTSDGMILSPLLVAGLNQGICFTISVVASTNIDKLQLIFPSSNDPTSATLQTQSFSLPSQDPFLLCVYDCTKLCFLFNECTGCAANPNCTWCDSTQQCLQSSVAKNCSVSYSNNECPCSDYSASCAKCSESANCGWCCENGGASGTCIPASTGATNCTGSQSQWVNRQCTGTCVPACSRGACVCGVCQCPSQWTGPTCDWPIGCNGVINSTEKYDQCGICGGNNTACAGCDGVPNSGLQYDACGVCGGNGAECFNLCSATDCVSCASTAEYCQWCYSSASGNSASGTCVSRGNCTTATGDPTSLRCQNKVSTVVAVAASIGAGILAAIIIAIIICLALSAAAGTKAYQVYMSKKRMMGEAQTNPMYVESKNTGTNPMFEDR